LARRGRRVVVFERNRRAVGASVRNFGMLWPIGQPDGPRRVTALRSLEIWREVLADAEIWHENVGSIHLAHHDDEAQVLREFHEQSLQQNFPCDILSPEQVLKRSPFARREGLALGLESRHEICVDPREVVARLPDWLTKRFGVRFEFSRTVVGYDRPRVLAPGGPWEADRLFICAGEDIQTLYPDAFADAQLRLCKLQMMRTAPLGPNLRIGPMPAAGLTLRHYDSFAGCPSLPSLRARVARENPEFDRFGIHVMASQNGRGEVSLGDSHEYGDDAIRPFDSAEIESIILKYLNTFLDIPDLKIAERWQGVYLKHAGKAEVVVRPEPGVVLVAGVGGAGMTLSFGLAERVVDQSLEKASL